MHDRQSGPIPARSIQPRPLQAMFARVPGRYDILNRLLTLGLDERWRARAVRACLAERPRRVLDLACGTGDLALRLARRAPRDVGVLAADFSAPMLEVARRKAGSRPPGARVAWALADAAELPFGDRSLDCVAIAFGLRNLTYKNPRSERYLAEIRRVLSPAGRFVAVETSQPPNALLRAAFHLYLSVVVARLGQLVSGQGSAYHYLAHSARHYFSATALAGLLRDSGFAQVEYQPLLGGVAAIHIASGSPAQP